MMHLAHATFERLTQQIRGLCGLALSGDKTYLIHHRLGPVAQRFGLKSYEELCDRLAAPGPSPLHDEVVEAITTHETSFFRDGHPFEALRQVLLPEVLEAARRRRLALGVRPYARILCAGASTGQEAYSVALLLKERAGNEAVDCAILATDISGPLMAEARAGVYSEREVLRSVPARLRMRYFEKHGARLQVNQVVRRLVEFRRGSLLDGVRELGLFDLIMCRNVLMYFDEETRRRVCGHFGEMLWPGGVLLLGSAENLYGMDVGFVSERHGATLFYRKS
jgi:chemotaxis protein methyltransferase CheR